MGETILKIGVGELQTIRIHQSDGSVLEMSVDRAKGPIPNLHVEVSDAIKSLCGAIQRLSSEGIEFVIPVAEPHK